MLYEINGGDLYITENETRECIAKLVQSTVYLSKNQKSILYLEEQGNSDNSVLLMLKEEGHKPICIAKDVVPCGITSDLNVMLLIKNHPSIKSYDRRKSMNLYLLEKLKDISLIAQNINHCFLHEKQSGEVNIY